MSWFGWDEATPGSQAVSFADWWTGARKRFPRSSRKGFDSLVVLVSWLLWKEQNNRTFDRRAQSAREFQAAVGNEIVMWIQGGFKSLEVAAVVTNRVLGRLGSSFPNG